MEREPVVSSVISEVGYDPKMRILEILFQSGAIYLYHFVPQAVHTALMGAASHGTFFNKEIRGTYEHRRIAGPHDLPRRARKRPLRSRRKSVAPPPVVPAVIESIPAKPAPEKAPARTERTTRKRASSNRKSKIQNPKSSARETGRASASQGNAP